MDKPQTGVTSIVWTMDAKRLFSKDRLFVSPAFEFHHGRPVPFKIILQAKKKSQSRGGETFCRARGVGSVQLKCEASSDDLPAHTMLSFRVAVGQDAWRGPVTHDFA